MDEPTTTQRFELLRRTVKEFHVALWRQDPDTTGCNWNARIERVAGSAVDDTTWWDVVPQMREQFNLR